jgi:hypothetical protein
MPARVYVSEWIIQAIAVPVKALGVGGIRYNGIRADESAHACIIVPCPVIVKPRTIQSLPCKKNIGGIRRTF